MGPRRSLCRRVGGARALERGFGQASLPWAHGRFPLYLLKPEHFLQQEGPPSSLTEETEAPGRGLARGLAQLPAVVRLSSCHQPFARPLLPSSCLHPPPVPTLFWAPQGEPAHPASSSPFLNPCHGHRSCQGHGQGAATQPAPGLSLPCSITSPHAFLTLQHAPRSPAPSRLLIRRR